MVRGLANDNLGMFLLDRFPGGRWISLDEGLDREDGGLGIGVFPLRSLPPKDLKIWLDAYRIFDGTAYAFLDRPTGTGYSEVIQSLTRNHAVMRNDPLLESCYWEKLYYLYLQNSAFGDKNKDENLKMCVGTIASALREGYPAAHLYNEWGAYLLKAGDLQGAKKAFQQAVKANPRFRIARENLKTILNKSNPPKAGNSG